MHRLFVIVAGTTILLGVALYVKQQQSPYLSLAEGLMGESWYQITLQNQHVGYLYNRGVRDASGRLHFTTTTHFLLQDGEPNTITKQLTFAARAPHELKSARYENVLGGRRAVTEVVAGADSYIARLTREANRNQLDLDWRYGLEDFVGFEHWLHTQSPAAPAQYLVRVPDFERLRVTSRSYEVLERNDTGYLVQTRAPLSATQTQLDEFFRPVRLTMAGIFTIVASTQTDAIALSEMRHKTSYLIPLNRRLSDHTQLTRLQLQVDHAGSLPLPRRLDVRAGAVTASGANEQYTREELRYPISDPTIQTLVQQALAATGRTASDADTLVDTAHRALRYAEGRPAGSVLEALRVGAGECTDYADLYTTLARAAGLPARTVYGLAYKDGTAPSFMFHAWNEVYSEGEWRAVDPTWNQRKTDATHIPLTDAQAANLMLAQSRATVAFNVLATEYP